MEISLYLPARIYVFLALVNLPFLPCRLFTDRYALPSGSKTTHCDPGAQTWCGGTWTAILENLDYIQNAGFTAGTRKSPLASPSCLTAP